MNGWKETPKEYKDCVRQKHMTTRINIGMCYNKYRCDECGIEYVVDSS